jgi:glycine C-acetyltransferase
MTTNLNWIVEEIKNLKTEGLYNDIRTISSPQTSWFYIDGRRVLNFCSNNYLGLANHPYLVQAAKKAIDEFGVGPGAVRVISGTNELHIKLEQRVAEFKKVEAALSFTSGFNANLGAIPALVGKEDVIFSDELNHASIIDGSRLSRARIVRFRHADPQDLQAKIQENRGTYQRGLVITVGVFSMDGDIAPLDKLYAITNQYENLMLMVDDAHGEGVLGKNGRGIVDHFGLHGKVDVEIGTFSKALGVMGGVVAGKKEIIEWLRQRARTFIFSSASTPADVGACIAAIDLLEESGRLVDRLWENTQYFKDQIGTLGFDTGASQTPIIPVIIGDALQAQQFSKELFEQRIFALPLAFPIVPRGQARIRVMISAAHQKECLDYGLEQFEKIGKKMGLI